MHLLDKLEMKMIENNNNNIVKRKKQICFCKLLVNLEMYENHKKLRQILKDKNIVYLILKVLVIKKEDIIN